MGTISEAIQNRIQQRDAEQPATPIRGLEKPDLSAEVDRLVKALTRDDTKAAPPPRVKVPGQHAEFRKNFAEAVKTRIAQREAETPVEALKGLQSTP
ncbi:MAG: hypothetical protein WCK18_15825 [Prolixibacteraceae bacterium]